MWSQIRKEREGGVARKGWSRIRKVVGEKDEARQGFRGLGFEGVIPGRKRIVTGLLLLCGAMVD